MGTRETNTLGIVNVTRRRSGCRGSGSYLSTRETRAPVYDHTTSLTAIDPIEQDSSRGDGFSQPIGGLRPKLTVDSPPEPAFSLRR